MRQSGSQKEYPRNQRNLKVEVTERAILHSMEVILRIPDKLAERLKAHGGDLSRHVLEAVALEGYRDRTLSLLEISELLGLTRVETDYFLGRHQVELATLSEADLDRESHLYRTAKPSHR